METLENTLKARNHFCIFVDDGGTPKSPGYLVEGLKIYAGVTMKSEEYRNAERELGSLVKCIESKFCIQPEELHASDLIRPKRHSPWRDIASEDKAQILSQWYRILKKSASFIPAAFIGKPQYHQLIPQVPGKQLDTTNVDWSQHAKGLEAVFHKELMALAQQLHIRETLVIVQDRDSKRRHVDITRLKGEAHVFNDAVHYRDSREIKGIWLADLSAFSLNRMFHLLNRPPRTDSLFDEIIRNEFNRWLMKRTVALLKL